MLITPKGYAIGDKFTAYGATLTEIKINLMLSDYDDALNIRCAFYSLNEDMTYKHLYISLVADNTYNDNKARYAWLKVTGIRLLHTPNPLAGDLRHDYLFRHYAKEKQT